MAGSYPGFNATQFREAILFAMNMGTPTETEQRAMFYWTPRKEFPVSDGDAPFDWTDTPSSTIAPDPVEIPCAIEYGASSSQGTPLGTIDPATGEITVLDQHYPSLFDDDDVRADLVVIDGATYVIEYEKPPIGLFDATVHQFVIQAQDEA